MTTVKVSMDDDLLVDVDRMASEGGQTRGAFIRAALHAELKRRRTAALEEVHRQSFLTRPDDDFEPPARRVWTNSSKER